MARCATPNAILATAVWDLCAGAFQRWDVCPVPFTALAVLCKQPARYTLIRRACYSQTDRVQCISTAILPVLL